MNMLPSIRVMVVDDHPVVRGGIRFTLLAFDDIELVGEAGSGEEALRLCAEVQPDVILMDLKLPGIGGVAATRAICEQYPRMQVIALTSFREATLVRGALQAGAIGYLLKDVAMDELAAAIRGARAGRAVLAPEAAQALVEAVTQRDLGDPSAGSELAPSTSSELALSLSKGQALTGRQREVLALMVEGLSNAEIAGRLSISLPTARFHVSQILDKLGAANRAEAAALAVKHRLVP